MRARALLLALTVVLAGCSLPGLTGTVASPGGASPGAGSPTATVDPDNPWREAELAIAVRAPPGDDRAYRPMVAEALAYWEGAAQRYAGYPIAFRLVEATEDADIVVRFAASIDDCGDVTDVAGCAPVPSPGDRLERPQTVRVRTGLSNASTVRVLKHEFGHALGLDHDDEPQPLMAPASELTTLPMANATERALPWRDPELSVYVEYGNATDTEGVRDQVGHALAYFEGGADGTVPANLTFVTTRNRSDADVVVRLRDTACREAQGSCARRAGVDLDGDGALEYYTRLEVTLAGVDTDATGWHVARWLGYGMGFDEDADYPPPLRNATYEERRGEWWT